MVHLHEQSMVTFSFHFWVRQVEALWMNPESWASHQRSDTSVWPQHMVHSSLTRFCLRPDNHSIRHTQHGGDEPVIPEVNTHKQACNPQNYTNLLWNWLNLQIRLVLQHQPYRAYSSGTHTHTNTQIHTVHTNKQTVERLWMLSFSQKWWINRSTKLNIHVFILFWVLEMSRACVWCFYCTAVGFKSHANQTSRVESHNTIITLI